MKENEYTIVPLCLAKVKGDMSLMTYRRNLGVTMELPVFFWYVKGSDKTILIDTGVDAEDARKRLPPGDPLVWNGVQTFEEALASQGLSPDDIDYVIQTHGAQDHIGNTAKCRKATIIMQEEEWKFTMSPHPVLADIHKPFLLSGWNRLQLVKGDVPDIFPGIDLIFAPGHSPGCQAVALNTAKGKVVISGFCCIEKNFEPHEEIKPYYPMTPPGIHVNALQAFDSMVRVAGIADILIPQHAFSIVGKKSIP